MEDKIKWISENMDKHNNLLVRTDIKQGWFVHFSYTFKGSCDCIYRGTVYKSYSKNIDSELDRIIEIIKLKVEKDYHEDTVRTCFDYI